MSKREMFYIYHDRPMSAENAFMTAEFLDSVMRMLWLKFGDDMADYQGRVFPDNPPSRYVCDYCKRRMSHEDEGS